jgi:hypothetical protein
MVGTNAPAPAEPKRANKQRRQRKPECESVVPVNHRKTEKDVAKLIGCLAEWTREMEAARSAASEVPTRKGRSSSDSQKAVSTMPVARFYPRGNPLTESMEFRDRDGVDWLAYIEAGRRAQTGELGSVTVLPSRRLRFDSATESRFASFVPAGSPFLAEARLQLLLDEARPDLPQPSTTGLPARALLRPQQRVIKWSTRAVESGREAIANGSRQWQQTGSRTKSLRRHVVELLSGAGHTMHATAEILLGHRPVRS